jgi:hypothetical protein
MVPDPIGVMTKCGYNTLTVQEPNLSVVVIIDHKLFGTVTPYYFCD